MRKFLLVFVLFFSFLNVFSQEELNAIVSINADQVQSTNKQVYKTLENSLKEFINQTKWTNKKFLQQERINCAFTIIVSEQNSNTFKASIQVQATRPVYGSSYQTPIINTNDLSLTFQYNEFDPLIYSPNNFDSNLISTVVFYVYTVLGLDADTFALKGGQEYFEKAQNVVLQAQQGGGPGWENKIGVSNRYALNENLLSSKFEPLRKIYYDYHLKGFDTFSKNERASKAIIATNILKLESLYNLTIGNNMIRLFLDAKSDEIVKVFSDGSSTGKEQKLKEVLARVSPTLRDKWNKISD